MTEPRFEGPYRVVKRIGQVNYEISKPDQPRKIQVCHIDRLKPYFQEDGKATIRNGTMRPEGEGRTVMCMRLNQELPEEEGKWAQADGTHLSNTESLGSIRKKLQHLKGKQKAELMIILRENESIFTNVPRRHRSVMHEIEVRGGRPIKQSAYWVSLEKRELMRKDVEYLLANDLAEPSNSEWSSSCLLVRKSDGT